MFLQRSHPIPVAITLHGLSELSLIWTEHKPHIQAVLKQFVRAKSLRIIDTHDSANADAIMSSIFSHKAPLLEDLYICTTQYRYLNGDPHEPRYLDLRNKALFHGKHPVLSSLTLKNVNVSRDTTLLCRSLTYLCIQNVAHEARFSSSDLLEILSDLPELRQLDLTHCLPDVSDVALPHTVSFEDRVELQHLSRIRFHSNSHRELEYLTAHVLVPLSAQYYIVCENVSLETTPPNPEVIQAFARCVHNHLMRGNDLPDESEMDCFRYMRFAGPGYTSESQRSSFCWSALADPVWETPEYDKGLLVDLNNMESDPAPRIQVDFIWTDLVLNEEAGLVRTREICLATSLFQAAIVSNLPGPLSMVRHIIISGVLIPFTFFFSVGLPRAHNVESLTLCSISALRALHALVAPAHDYTQGPRSIFPKLKRIAIRDAHLDDHLEGFPGNTLEHYLDTVLRARAAAGAEDDPANPIEHLRLSACGGIWGGADLLPLRELVEDLEWDKLIIPDMEARSDALT
ncbi:hypothetical protein PENSPDRAFT_360625 [Peniophora sp. CONT]|nr:hypothetical protein PENSPDRAFT_360625 [Peniophora sp. CONT]